MLFISDVLVSPTGRGWQPVQISSWWWCICWNETLFPAPASDDLYKRLCIFPSFLFYLRSRQKKKTTHILQFLYFSLVRLFLFKFSVFIFCRPILKSDDSHSGDMHVRTSLSALGIFIRLLFKSTSILLRLQKRKLDRFIYNCSTMSFKEPAIRSSTLTSWTAKVHKKVHKLLCIKHFKEGLSS